MRKTFCAAVAVVGCLAIASSAHAGGPVGWRTDGTGRYPNADPPTEWSATKNVVWATPASAWSTPATQPAGGRGAGAKRTPPTWSNATPIIVGEKIFITSELTDLVCLNKADGKVLWVRGNAYEDYMTDADRAQAAADKAQADKIRKEEIAPLQKQANDLRKEVQKLQPRTTQPDGAEAKAQIAAIKPRIADADKQVEQANAKLVGYTRWELPGTNGTNGHSSATPTSDGRVVCAQFNTGTVACYDLDGNRKWITFLEHPEPGSYGVCTSPVLCGDRVIVGARSLFALDLATGKQLWKCDKVELRFGTPLVTKVGPIDVAVTAGSDVVRVSDGKLLTTGKRLIVQQHSAPIVQDGVVYFVQYDSKAVKLSPKGEDDVETQVLWSRKLKDNQNNHYASAVLHDGLIYAINQVGVFSVLQAADGTVVYEKKLEQGKGAVVYPSVTLAGKYLYVSSDDGTTLVLEPGREYKEVARNTLELFRSCPVFEGRRLYIRAYGKMYCIGQ